VRKIPTRDECSQILDHFLAGHGVNHVVFLMGIDGVKGYRFDADDVNAVIRGALKASQAKVVKFETQLGVEGKRRGGRIGGKRCMVTMTPAERSARAKRACDAREAKRNPLFSIPCNQLHNSLDKRTA
jgi:hypothetical protein